MYNERWFFSSMLFWKVLAVPWFTEIYLVNIFVTACYQLLNAWWMQIMAKNKLRFFFFRTKTFQTQRIIYLNFFIIFCELKFKIRQGILSDLIGHNKLLLKANRGLQIISGFKMLLAIKFKQIFGGTPNFNFNGKILMKNMIFSITRKIQTVEYERIY